MPPPAGASEAESRFAMMFHRFRENEAREDLSPFERLLSIGEIYEALAEAETAPPSAVAFAERIGVHESLVSRARAVLRHKDTILNTFKTPYDMSASRVPKIGSRAVALSIRGQSFAPLPISVSPRGRSIVQSAVLKSLA